MTSDGHMVTMKKVGIAELKAGLSAYLAEVRGGDRVRAAFSLQTSTYLGLEQLTLNLAGMKK